MTFEIDIAGADIALPCEPDESVLDAIERAGFVVPYSCRKGVCATCECTLVAGSLAIGRSSAIEGPKDSVRLCVAKPRSDIRIAPRAFQKATLHQRKRFSATVYRVERLALDVSALHLRLPIGRRMPFRAGQYIRVHFGAGESRNYSLANAPRDNAEILLHIRHVPGGAFSGKYVPGLKPGDGIDVEGPFGQFGIDEDSDAPMLMLATGTGFAPISAILSDLLHRRIRRPVHVFWGGMARRDIYGLARLQQLAERNSWFRFTPVLATKAEDWEGATGFIQHAALAQYRDLSGIHVLACGNPNMISDARSLFLSQGGLPERAFLADAFLPSGGEGEG